MITGATASATATTSSAAMKVAASTASRSTLTLLTRGARTHDVKRLPGRSDRHRPELYRAHMNPLRQLLQHLKGSPKAPEDIAADAESKRLQDQNLDVRLSQRSGSAGENYQSGRGSR